MSPTPSVFLGEEVFKMFHLFPVLNKSFKREAVFRFGHRSVRFIYRYPLLVLLVFSVSKLEWKKMKGVSLEALGFTPQKTNWLRNNDEINGSVDSTRECVIGCQLSS